MYVETKVGGLLRRDFGRGKTMEAAACDYWGKIQGQRLVYKAMYGEHRKEFLCVGNNV